MICLQNHAVSAICGRFRGLAKTSSLVYGSGNGIARVWVLKFQGPYNRWKTAILGNIAMIFRVTRQINAEHKASGSWHPVREKAADPAMRKPAALLYCRRAGPE